MNYSNVIYLLVVILVLSTNNIPDTPQIALTYALPLFILKGIIFQYIVRFHFRPERVRNATRYSASEQRTSILAILFFAVDIYLLDIKYFLAAIPLISQIPSLINLWGLVLFFCYLSFIWLEAKRSYQVVFGRAHTGRSFLSTNIRMNLPIVLPWLLLSMLSDILQLTSFPALKKFLSSPWGEPTIFLVFFAILALVFPAIVTRIWNCTPLPSSTARLRIEEFCKKQQLKYANIMTWPLFEGQVITAGVMGLIKKFRYILVTPALLKTMTPEEVNAVIAHEIGHVKKYHLQLYILLLLGFAPLAQLSAISIQYFLLKTDFLYYIIDFSSKGPQTVLDFMSTVLPSFVLMIVYFRFVFGFFMRNFERQADLHVFSAMESCWPLVRVLEKIAWLAGGVRDLPCWHHFSIAQRVNFLKKCQENYSHIRKHNLKIYCCLGLYLVTITASLFALWKMPVPLPEGAPLERYLEAIYMDKIENDPKNPTWYHLLGDFQLEREMYEKGIDAYEHALKLRPGSPDTLNNLAWLLLTSTDKEIQNPVRALALSKKAAAIRPQGYIMDTLATAYWKNGLLPPALNTERQAIAVDPKNRDYYLKQMEKFAAPRRLDSLMIQPELPSLLEW
ncbi:MAG: M48 family metalloprotease [Desulfobulbaceae bacterium]|nr:M48 family metalloprotease [Desulfobulbaceae bacterium]